MPGYEIISIDEYQRRADKRYYEAVAEYQRGERAHYPARSMFMYVNNYGEPRKSGYVLVWNAARSRWFKTRREAAQYANEQDKFWSVDK